MKLSSKLIFIFAFTLSSVAIAEQCENDNAGLRAMALVKVTFSRIDGSSFSVDAKYANNDRTRAAGFQRVCAERVDSTLILFEFDNPLMPRFHMHNVVVPLDIAFIDQDSEIESIQLMNTYSLLLREKPLYGPSRPIIAALEAHKGFYQKHSLDSSSKISWELIDTSGD